MSPGTRVSSAAADRFREAPPGPCGRHRTGTRRRGYEDVPRERRRESGPAVRIRRTAPSRRRDRHADRTGRFASVVGFRRWHVPPPAGERSPAVSLETFVPPLSGDLRDSPFRAYSFGEAPPAFQSRIPLRSVCLRVSGAVAPSAAACPPLPQGSSARPHSRSKREPTSLFPSYSGHPPDQGCSGEPDHRRLNATSSGVTCNPSKIRVPGPSSGLSSGTNTATSSR